EERRGAHRDRSSLPAADGGRSAHGRRDESAQAARMETDRRLRRAREADGRRGRRSGETRGALMFWEKHRVLLTGGGGFFGGFIRERLEREHPAEILAPRAIELDLLDVAAVRDYLRAKRPTLIIHAAGVVGGIGANRNHPGQFFYENAVMGIHLIEEARLAAVEKFVCLGTICAYPKFATVPFREDELWNGYPEETNAPYGIAKKALLVQLQAYRQEYGFRGIYLLPVNLYGPRDNFDPESSHVIPAMIRKFVEAKDRDVVLWGDGSP